MQTPVQFRNHRRQLLHGVVHKPSSFDTAIIYLHGFPGTMNGSAKRFCTALTRYGFLCLRFNFSGTAPSEGAFEHKLMSAEVKDVRAAVDYIHAQYSPKRIVLVGLSTGAIDAALYAHTDKRLSAVVLLSSVSDLETAVHYDFTGKQVRDFWEKGYITYHRPGHWTHRKKLRKAFYDEFFRLDIGKALRKYRRPLLIVHGEQDAAIPVREARAVYELAHKPKKLVIVPKADHTFDKRGTRSIAVAAIVRFIRALR